MEEKTDVPIWYCRTCGSFHKRTSYEQCNITYDLTRPVEESQAPPASPAQLSAREFKLNGFSLLEILGRHFGQTGMVKYELVPEVAAWAEAFRDASQRQPQSVSEEQKSGFICAKWKKLSDGCVARCDKDHGHDGDHLDSVILIGWSEAFKEESR